MAAYVSTNTSNYRVYKMAFEGLEPLAGKLAWAVLRGLGAGNSPWLLGVY